MSARIEPAAWDAPDVRALEAVAVARGWTTLRLETGPLQPEAVGLDTGAGYRPIGAFGAYAGDPDAADSLFFERVLRAR